MRGRRALTSWVAVAAALWALSGAALAAAATSASGAASGAAGTPSGAGAGSSPGATGSLGSGSGGSPISPGLPQASSTPTAATTPTATAATSTSSPDSGLSGTNAIAIVIGAVVVLVGISFFIWRDARRRAPVRHRAVPAGTGAAARPGSKRAPKPRKLSPAERRRRKRGRAR